MATIKVTLKSNYKEDGEIIAYVDEKEYHDTLNRDFDLDGNKVDPESDVVWTIVKAERIPR